MEESKLRIEDLKSSYNSLIFSGIPFKCCSSVWIFISFEIFSKKADFPVKVFILSILFVFFTGMIDK